VQHKESGYIMVMKKLEKTEHPNTFECKKEIEILRDLSHPNIISYIGACVKEGRLHPLIEYVNGGTFDQLLQDTTITLTWCQRVQFAIDIASGIKYLHEKGWL
ncbi:protein kinase, partial [Salmonella sp. s51228]|uniref:protein kinase n=1 Tax=Salmonella sp. s51228 TaxID=3159652 RepID=UPI00397F8B13